MSPHEVPSTAPERGDGACKASVLTEPSVVEISLPTDQSDVLLVAATPARTPRPARSGVGAGVHPFASRCSSSGPCTQLPTAHASVGDWTLMPYRVHPSPSRTQPVPERRRMTPALHTPSPHELYSRPTAQIAPGTPSMSVRAMERFGWLGARCAVQRMPSQWHRMFAPTAQTSVEASAVTPSRPGPHELATVRHAVPSQCRVIARFVLKFQNCPTAQASLREISATASNSLASSDVPVFGVATRVHAVPFQR